MNQRIPIVGSKTWLTHPYFYDFTFIFFVFLGGSLPHDSMGFSAR